MLAATAGGQTSDYLQGIGEYQADWHYYLADGAGSVRQLSDAQGQVTGTRSFSPWGEVLAASGQSELASGYLGGLLDAATGLIYVGNGQYYDPATGRFLTRGVFPGAPNPYVPWQGNPLGMIVGPLALLALIRGRRKAGRLDRVLVVVIVLVAVNLACALPGEPPTPTSIPTIPPSATSTPTDPGSQSSTPGTIAPPPAKSLESPDHCKSKFDKIIFICGRGDGTECANGTAPLHPFRRWAERNDYTASDFIILDVDGCGGTKLECANQAKSFIEGSVGERFLLIGHSAGADAVIVAADRVADKAKFTGIVLLDPTLTAALENDPNPGVDNLQIMADNLPKPVFLGEGGDGIDVHIAVAYEIDYPYNHNQLALEDQVVFDMVDSFGWSECKK